MDTVALDRAITTLQERKRAWAEMPLIRRIEYLRQVLEATARVAERQVRVACEHKGIPFDAPPAGEEWMAGPLVQARVVRTLLESLEHLEQHARVRLDPRAVRQRERGQLVAQVFPASNIDRVLYAGIEAEVWLAPEVTWASLPRHMAGFYRQERPAGAVALVLGAGNVASIAPLDLVHKLFVEGRVGHLKLNPVNAYLAPFIEETFADLIRDGFVRLSSGGADEGEYLVMHPGIEEIHITGSNRTHDAIVFGPGDEGRERKARNEPRFTKRVTSELGDVSPVIVVPGDWNESDVDFHAQNIATQLANNAGFNCNAVRVLITQRGWPLRHLLLERVQRVLAEVPPRPAYYPGAEERFDRLLARHPAMVQLGTRRPGVLPWAIVPDLDPAVHDDPCFTTEAFCGLMGETALDGRDAGEFLHHAVAFANERLWGTLNACVILDPATEKRLGADMERAIAELRYGTVATNHWPALAFGLGVTPWGAFPGHGYQDIQSGIGFVHNTLLFDRPQKAVIRGSFRMRPKPPWFVTHKRAHKLGPKLVEIETHQRLDVLPGIVYEALRG